MDRRSFLQTLGAAAALSATPSLLQGAETSATAATTATHPALTHEAAALAERITKTATDKGLPVRLLGRTGVKVSTWSFGSALLANDIAEKDSSALVHEVIDRGVNYIDTAAQYGKQYGDSERRLGLVIPQRRAEVFLSTKTLERTYEKSKAEFAKSLRNLKVDYVDMLQIHAINSAADLEAVFAKDGAMRAALEAQQAGLCRYIGITGHTRPAIINEALERYPFASVLIPLGIADTYLNDFAQETIPVARKHGAAVIAMKVFGAGKYLPRLDLPKCLAYAIENLKADTAIVGVLNKQQLDENFAAYKALKELSATDLASLREQAKPLGTTDTLWWKASA